MWCSAGILVTVVAFVSTQSSTSTTSKTTDEETQESTAFSNPYMPSSAFKNIFTDSMSTLTMVDDGSTLDYPSMSESERRKQKITSPLPSNTASTVQPPETYADTTGDFVDPAKHLQRGVLDLLFPKARVQTFKSVFDGFRRFLSYTFK